MIVEFKAKGGKNVKSKHILCCVNEFKKRIILQCQTTFWLKAVGRATNV